MLKYALLRACFKDGYAIVFSYIAALPMFACLVCLCTHTHTELFAPNGTHLEHILGHQAQVGQAEQWGEDRHISQQQRSTGCQRRLPLHQRLVHGCPHGTARILLDQMVESDHKLEAAPYGY